MAQPLTDEQIREALKTCVDEPVHVPGTIQPMGYVLACDFDLGSIHQASANCFDLFGKPLPQVFEDTVATLFGRDIWHSLRNVIGFPNFAEARQYVGTVALDGAAYALHASKGGERCVLEVEPLVTEESSTLSITRGEAFLIQQVEYCTNLTELFDSTVEFLKHFTGFDRVSIIRFDEQWNGSIVAEACSSLLEPLVGLCFPAHDVPAQAREIMRITPYRIISDVAQSPVPLLARDKDEPPLDMTHAVLRGVSPVHIQYLHNFGLGATMSLSITLGGRLWGYVSFHSVEPRVAPPDVRRLLLSFMPVFRLKLDLIQREQDLRLSRQIDGLQADVKLELEKGSDLQEMLNRVGPAIVDVLDAAGVAMTNGSEYFVFGQVPETAIIAALSQKAREHPGKALAETALAKAFPELAPHLGGFAGALVTVYEDDRCLQVFRREITESVHWAGNPSKTVEMVDNALRIQPRNSFSSYLEEVKGQCKAWTRGDKHLMRQLWPLLSAAERRAFMADLNRQQKLMINELNHRVRNILSLVKSVSTQARRVGGSLESYSQALEARIHALAAAHDIGAGAAKTSVSIHQIVQLEAEPYVKDQSERVSIHGVDASIRAESAPIFALVIHELMTNAVKYGALSVHGATVDVETQSTDDGVALLWKEQNGPPTRAPEAFGFGTTLIQQAVPYEMGGTAELNFRPTGVEAKLELPMTALGDVINAPGVGVPQKNGTGDVVVTKLRNGMVMVLEDNFMIAKEMRARLMDAGFPNVEMVPSAEQARALLDATTPAMAVLDINLGHGETSEGIANELLSRRVPFMFVTGFGEENNLPPHLQQAQVLTKPVTTRDVVSAVHRMDVWQ